MPTTGAASVTPPLPPATATTERNPNPLQLASDALSSEVAQKVRRTGVNTTRRQRLRQTALVRPSPRAATAAVAARRISCCYSLSLSLSCSCWRCYRRSSCSAPQLLRLPQLLALLPPC
jgi:hypothetical protein